MKKWLIAVVICFTVLGLGGCGKEEPKRYYSPPSESPQPKPREEPERYYPPPLELPQPKPRVEPCFMCDGRGGKDVKCTWCEGRGRDEYGECSSCRGIGHKWSKCISCNGTGVR